MLRNCVIKNNVRNNVGRGKVGADLRKSLEAVREELADVGIVQLKLAAGSRRSRRIRKGR